MLFKLGYPYTLLSPPPYYTSVSRDMAPPSIPADIASRAESFFDIAALKTPLPPPEVLRQQFISAVQTHIAQVLVDIDTALFRNRRDVSNTDLQVAFNSEDTPYPETSTGMLGATPLLVSVTDVYRQLDVLRQIQARNNALRVLRKRIDNKRTLISLARRQRARILTEFMTAENSFLDAELPGRYPETQ